MKKVKLVVPKTDAQDLTSPKPLKLNLHKKGHKSRGNYKRQLSQIRRLLR